jgi:cytoskeleton protein RodZ
MTDPRSDDSTTSEGTTPEGEGISLGHQLRQAREARGMTAADVATALRVPNHVVIGLESDDHERLGAPIFVRGHALNYARLVGVPVDLVAGVARQAEPPPLVAMAPSTRLQRFVEQAGRRAIYVVLTGVLVVPVFIVATQGPEAPTRVSLDAPLSPGTSVGTTLDLGIERTEVPIARPQVMVPDTVIASIAPFRPRAQERLDAPRAASAASAVENDTFVLRFKGESWVEVFGHDGRRLEQALMRDGDELRFPAGEVARVTLGNAGVVEVVSDGDVLDTAPFSRANVARFAVSSEGRLATLGG